jgi:hypothetical protein
MGSYSYMKPNLSLTVRSLAATKSNYFGVSYTTVSRAVKEEVKMSNVRPGPEIRFQNAACQRADVAIHGGLDAWLKILLTTPLSFLAAEAPKRKRCLSPFSPFRFI